MKDITQVLDRLSPQIADLLRQAQTGGPDAVSDADVHQAYQQVARSCHARNSSRRPPRPTTG